MTALLVNLEFHLIVWKGKIRVAKSHFYSNVAVE